MIILLLALCLRSVAHADDASSKDVAPQKVQHAVERAIGYLQSDSAAWVNQGRCAACHHVAMPLWALNEAGKHGYTVDQKFLADTLRKSLESPRTMMASGLMADPAKPPDPRPMARGVSTGAIFMAVAAQSFSTLDAGESASLKLIAADILKKQQQDGSWEFFLSRPPINESQATDAAWIVMALQGEAGVGQPQRDAVRRGISWLASAEPTNQQAKALKLLVAVRSGESRDKLQGAINELLALQRPDGGWGQTAQLPSDAFATGEFLYVLSLAGCEVTQSPIRRAIAFLCDTQKPDGSWPMKSRATPDGRPGSAKLLTPITSGATSWATMALARLVPSRS